MIDWLNLATRQSLRNSDMHDFREYQRSLDPFVAFDAGFEYGGDGRTSREEYLATTVV